MPNESGPGGWFKVVQVVLYVQVGGWSKIAVLRRAALLWIGWCFGVGEPLFVVAFEGGS